jgi:hypothetical protein
MSEMNSKRTIVASVKVLAMPLPVGTGEQHGDLPGTLGV